MAASSHKVILVGLGTVAQTHLKALQRVAGADVIAGVDTASDASAEFRGQTVPVYRSIREARKHHHADVVIIATPTPSHFAICAAVAESFPAARILVEKPAADKLADAMQVLEGIGSHQPVDVAYHMAYSPEVSWALQISREKADEIGVPIGAEATFADPYYDDYQTANATLVSSWIDSGINSLSVLSRFLDLKGIRSFRRIGEAPRSLFEAHVTCLAPGRELDVRIVTTWHVTDAAKITRISYDSSAVLMMDHTAVAGYLFQDNSLTAVFGSDKSVPRRERHYRALYNEWLVKGNRLVPPDTSVLLHRLLLQHDSALRFCNSQSRFTATDPTSVKP